MRTAPAALVVTTVMLFLTTACGRHAPAKADPHPRAVGADADCADATGDGEGSDVVRVSLKFTSQRLVVTWTMRAAPGPNTALYLLTWQESEKEPHFFSVDGSRAFVSYQGSELGSTATTTQRSNIIAATFDEPRLPASFDWAAEVAVDTEVVDSCPNEDGAGDGPRLHFQS